MFSKSFRGLAAYKMDLTGIEGLLMTIALLIFPLLIFTILSHFKTASGKSGTFGGITVVGDCWPFVKSLTRSDT